MDEAADSEARGEEVSARRRPVKVLVRASDLADPEVVRAFIRAVLDDGTWEGGDE